MSVLIGLGSGSAWAQRTDGPSPRLRLGGLDIRTRADLASDQWARLLLNLNNAVSALTNASLQTILETPGYRRVAAALVDEGLGVLREAGIKAARLRGLPVALMSKLLRLPTPVVKLVTRALTKMDPEESHDPDRPIWLRFAAGARVFERRTRCVSPIARRELGQSWSATFEMDRIGRGKV